MNRIRFLAVLAAAALPMVASLPAVAQTANQTTGAPKVIGQPQQPRVVPSMIVLNAKGAKLQAGKLVLDGVSPNAIIFADRPVRSAGHALTAHLLEEWSGNDSSPRRRPTPRGGSDEGQGRGGMRGLLKSPSSRRRLTFDVDVLEGDLAGGDGAASVFMDIINLPIARRTSHRGAWYHGTN